jgi:hypothetical protein
MGWEADQITPPTKCSQSAARDHRPHTICSCHAHHLRPLCMSVPCRPKGACTCMCTCTTQSGLRGGGKYPTNAECSHITLHTDTGLIAHVTCHTSVKIKIKQTDRTCWLRSLPQDAALRDCCPNIWQRIFWRDSWEIWKRIPPVLVYTCIYIYKYIKKKKYINLNI